MRSLIVLLIAFCVLCLFGVGVFSVAAIRNVRQQYTIPNYINDLCSLVQNLVRYEFMAMLSNDKNYSLENEKGIERVDKILSDLSKSDEDVADFVEKDEWARLDGVNTHI
ncbi:hypothetical protein AGMMS49957_15830 [Synergistales bacterium]|nr:hypothetical protein AGMMS49957_15830 [Synergistales bacterium]